MNVYESILEKPSQWISVLEEILNKHPPAWVLFITPVLVVLVIPISYYLFINFLQVKPLIC